ncbi:MAG: hypothetical protein COA93_11500 [Alphaproteobacteria bacterium]|nr:MAG: hypothetical protein COA93_11500 [Alphaproteobacteria bacterium]
MSPRLKFFILFVMSFSGFSAAILFFMATDYAKQEKAYFKQYPYMEMAARHNKDSLAPKTIPETPPRTEIIPQVIQIFPAPPRPIPVSTPEEPKPAETFKQIKIISNSLPAEFKKEKMPIVADVSPARKNIPPRETKETPPWRQAAAQGYEAYGRGDHSTAIMHFEQALKFIPEDKPLRLQLAYAYKILGQNDKAAENFKKVIDLDDDSSFPIKREIEQLENRFSISSYAIYRDESSNHRQLSGPDLTQSQAGLEVSYQPEKIGFKGGRKFQIYGRLMSGMTPEKFEPDPDSFQAGIGLRLKPLPDHNLVFSAERLIKIGDFARNDWMLRAGYSRDHGTDYREDKNNWWSYSLYLDAAILTPANPDIYLTAQAISGYNIALSPGLVLQPRMTGLLTWQKDSFQQASLIEAGPGINMRYYFNDSKYEAYRSHIDLTIEYRLKISGNSIGGSGPVVSLVVYF